MRNLKSIFIWNFQGHIVGIRDGQLCDLGQFSLGKICCLYYNESWPVLCKLQNNTKLIYKAVVYIIRIYFLHMYVVLMWVGVFWLSSFKLTKSSVILECQLQHGYVLGSWLCWCKSEEKSETHKENLGLSRLYTCWWRMPAVQSRNTALL